MYSKPVSCSRRNISIQEWNTKIKVIAFIINFRRKTNELIECQSGTRASLSDDVLFIYLEAKESIQLIFLYISIYLHYIWVLLLKAILFAQFATIFSKIDQRRRKWHRFK